MKSKIVKYIIIFIAVFFCSSMLLSWIYKDEIKKQLLESANQKIDARIEMDDLSLSLISSFPQAEVHVEGLHIIGKDQFKKDTLANVQSIELAISLWKYIQTGSIQINDLRINDAKIHAIVLPDGRANWDIAKPSSPSKESSESTSIDLQLSQYQLEDVEIIYDDQSRKFFTHLKGVAHSGSGNFKEDVFTLNSKTEVEKWDLRFLGKPILSKVKASLEAPIAMNFKKMEFMFTNNTLLLNELPIHFTYRLVMPHNRLLMDLQFASDKATVKNFLSLVPSIYAHQFDKVKADGFATLKGNLSGEVSDTKIPSFDMQVSIVNGSFAYENKPERIHNLQLALAVKNPTGDVSATTISLKPFNFSINQESIQSYVLIQNPMDNPTIEGDVKGRLQLKNISQLFPQEGISYAGNLHADMQFKGKLNALKAGKGQVKGTANVRNFTGSFKGKSIQIPLIEGKFSANTVQVQSNFNYLETPFEVKGGLSNVFGFVLKGENIGSDVKINVRDLEIKKAFDHFSIVQKYLPIAGNLIGTVSPSFTFKGNFNQAFDLDLSSVSAEGVLQTSAINGSSSTILNQILQAVKWKGSKQLHLDAAKLNFVIQNGRLVVKPFNLHTNIGSFAVSGSNGLDQTINYQVNTTLNAQLLDANLGQQVNQQLQKIKSNASIGGIISKIPLEFLISGTVTKPIIKVGISGKLSSKEAVKEIIKTEINTQKNNALEQAKKRADQELEKAKALAEEIQTKAYQEADKLVEQAANPIAKFAAKKLADKLKREADKQVEKILQDAQKRADEMIEKAKSE